MKTAFALTLSLICSSSLAQKLDPSNFTDGEVRIVVMNDQTGYGAAQSGVGSVKAAQMAALDFARSNPGFPKIVVTTIDHQAKPDIAITQGDTAQGLEGTPDAQAHGIGLGGQGDQQQGKHL